jgi:hypothetical protein
MSITQHTPGFDRPWENGAHGDFGSDIGFGWPCFCHGRLGAVESCDRPVNGAELIRQLLPFLFKRAAYLIHFDHLSPRSVKLAVPPSSRRLHFRSQSARLGPTGACN